MNRSFSIFFVVSASFFACVSNSALADVCPENPFGGPTVCVGWHHPFEPIEDDDFRIDYVTNPSAPDVELLTGALWRVYSVDPAAPDFVGDLGDIVYRHHPGPLRLTLADGDWPGARNVDRIILEPAPPYTASIFYGSRITGDLRGELTAKAHSLVDPGIVDLTIDGSAHGAWHVPDMRRVTIGGDFNGMMKIERLGVDTAINQHLDIHGDLNGSIAIDERMIGATICVRGQVVAGINTAC
jgi:hypothetical protein